MRRVALVWVVIASALALAACGSSSSGTSPTTVPTATTTTLPITKAAYIEQGNAICKVMNDQTAQLKASYPNGPSSNSEREQFLLATAKNVDDALIQLRALPRPAGDDATLTALYEQVGELPALARRMAVAAAEGDNATLQQLSSQGDGLSATANASSNAYGLTECGKPT